MPNLVTKFAALGDPIRLAIVERLLSDGEKSAGELLDVAPVSAPAISRHLKVLRNAGVIEQRIDRQKRIYRVQPSAVQAISVWTKSHEEFWAGGLDKLAAALDE